MAIAAMILRLFLAVLFIRAVAHKALNRQQFQRELRAYQLLPPCLLTPVVLLLIMMETVCVASLVLSQQTGLLIACLLLLVYGSAMAINLLRGIRHIDCGCTGPHGAKKNISWFLVSRNAVLAGLALLATLVSAPVPATSLPLIAAGSLCLILVYEAAEQALTNVQYYQYWLAQQSPRT